MLVVGLFEVFVELFFGLHPVHEAVGAHDLGLDALDHVLYLFERFLHALFRFVFA